MARKFFLLSCVALATQVALGGDGYLSDRALSSPITRESFVSYQQPSVVESGLFANDSGAFCESCRAEDSSADSDDGPLRLFGDIIEPTDLRFSDFVSPITNPVYFEDPRTVTEARFIYLRHKVPLAATGGELNLIACQLRAAITDRLSIIATKDGYATSTNPLIDDGWANVNAGLKYNLYSDVVNQRLISAGMTYLIPVGSSRTLQGNGDGIFNPFLTGGTLIGSNSHWVSTTGFWLPSSPFANSSAWFWSNHFDHRIEGTNVYLLTEFNWYHYMRSGKSFNLAPIEGGDLFNFGSVGVAGNSIVTGAIGLKYTPRDRVELGIAWEKPLTERRDVLDNRLTVDFIWRY